MYVLKKKIQKLYSDRIFIYIIYKFQNNDNI